MSENAAQTVQKVIQDVLAPDVRELKVLVAGLQKQMDQRFQEVDRRFEQMDRRFEQMDQQMNFRFQHLEERLRLQDEKRDAQFQAILTHTELIVLRAVSPLSKRLAALEAVRQPPPSPAYEEIKA